MKETFVRYRGFIVLAAVLGILGQFLPELAIRSVTLSWESLMGMMTVVPPVFVLLGLLDVWVPRETVIANLGEGSGLRGILLAFVLGSFAAGPLYAAFPIAGVLIRKGSRLFNVWIFLGAWSTTKIPMLVFEASSLGWPFMVTRLLANLPVILLIAWITERLLTREERAAIHAGAENI